MNAVTQFALANEIEPWTTQPIEADHEEDISDDWQEATDPDHEFNEECFGLFEVSPETGTVNLIGLRIEDGSTPLYCDREYALQMMAADVLRIELHLERTGALAA